MISSKLNDFDRYPLKLPYDFGQLMDYNRAELVNHCYFESYCFFFFRYVCVAFTRIKQQQKNRKHKTQEAGKKAKNCQFVKKSFTIVRINIDNMQ